MPDLTIAVTPAQLVVLRKLDANLSAKAVVQTHVDTWLAPLVAELMEEERKAVRAAYAAADTTTQARVKQELGLG